MPEIKEAEARGLRETIWWLHNLSHDQVETEMDCFQVFQDLKSIELRTTQSMVKLLRLVKSYFL